MTGADLQKFLLGLAEVLESSGAKSVAGELKDFAGALEHYRDRKLRELADVLGKARGEGAGDGRAKKAAAPGLDEGKIAAAFEKLQQLHARSLDPSVTPAAVEAVVKPLEQGMSAKELDELARRFGILKKQGSKAKAAKAIIDRIVGEKGAYARAHE